MKFFVLIFFNIILQIYCYVIPIPNFEIIPQNNNILVTIEAKEGLTLVVFHGARNRKIKLFESGDFKKQLSNNKWTFEMTNNFNQSDIIYYWLYAQYNGESYWLSDKKFELKTILSKLIDENITLSSAECSKTITTITDYNKQICKDQLIFEDTFDTYDPSKWQREIKFSGFDGEFVLYEDKPQNLYIEHGNLHIVPTLTNETAYKKMVDTTVDLANRCTESEQVEYFCRRNSKFRILPPITSAKIRTKETFSFRYGRIDVRAKLPKGDWIFPQIFLDPLKNIYASQQEQEYLAGQMRIAFIHGNEILRDLTSEGSFYHASKLSGGIVLHNSGEKFYASIIREEHFGNHFHVYSILWTDTEINLYMDDKLYGRLDNTFLRMLPRNLVKNNRMEPFQEPFYISLGVGVGGYKNFPDNTYTGKNIIAKPWQNDEPNAETKFWSAYDKWIKTWSGTNHEMIVDYIRIWAV